MPAQPYRSGSVAPRRPKLGHLRNQFGGKRGSAIVMLDDWENLLINKVSDCVAGEELFFVQKCIDVVVVDTLEL